MARKLTIGAAQLGPIARNEPRGAVVARMIELLRQAREKGCALVVFPELALTTFFPRWYMEEQAEVDAFFEREMPGPETRPLFDEAARLGIGFYLGYAELTEEEGRTRHFNAAILVNGRGGVVGKYRKVHLPGHSEHEPQRPFQHLERRYFEGGNLGFPVWRAFDGIVGMCICNDRRWPETYRVLGLQGVELVMVGYNTPIVNGAFPGEPIPLREFQNLLSVMAGAYQNGTWVVSVAKAGREEGVDMFGGTCIVAPSGEMVAKCVTLDDELIVYDCDLDLCRYIKENIFNFARYRRIDQYRLITERTEAIPPAE
jgi:predicted amidohydrolase